MSADIRILPTERDLETESISENFTASAMKIAEHRKDDIAGFAIVAWSERGEVTVQTAIGQRSPVMSQLLPTFIAEAIRTDLNARHVLRVLSEGAADTGGAA